MSSKPDLQKPKLGSAPTQSGPRLARVIAGLLRQISGDLNRIQADPEVAIHALRRRMKKLQSLILLVDRLTDRDTAKQIKRLILELKNAFAGDRDQNVMVALALKMGSRPLAHQFPRKEAFTASWVLTGCHAATAALEKILTSLPIQSLTWSELRAAHQRIERNAQLHWQQASKKSKATDLHECRKETKALYYQLLFLRLVKGCRKRRIRQVRRLGHWLGKHHDLQVFQTTLHEKHLLTRSLKKDIERRKKKMRLRALEAGRKLYDRD
ncbi:hypothetical protein BH11VER1_BH11VER1_29570 [soil metagenome]